MSLTPTPPAPDRVPGGDPGDETASRFRFQYTWAGIVSCMLLDDTQDVVEVFCEHHEDILIKHRDGRFTGEQVKTRNSDQPAWKTSDAQVTGALARFVGLEQQFPGQFRAFRFLTNHPLHVATNSQSLGYVLEQVAMAPTIADLPSSVRNLLQRIADEAGAPEAVAFQALKKSSASADLPKLQDSLIRLVHALTTSWKGASECSYEAVGHAARRLVDECARASGLDHQQLLPAYLHAVDEPEVETVARITGKRMTPERVALVLAPSLENTATLAGDPVGRVEPGGGSTALLMKKLGAGGFSAVSCNSAEDLRDKADYLAISWTKTLGRTRGLEQYDHVRSMTLNDAARAFEATTTNDRPFGADMREALRRRFRERRAAAEQLFDCSDDHLEGVAYSLTAQCKVLWSNDRPWEVP